MKTTPKHIFLLFFLVSCMSTKCANPSFNSSLFTLSHLPGDILTLVVQNLELSDFKGLFFLNKHLTKMLFNHSILQKMTLSFYKKHNCQKYKKYGGLSIAIRKGYNDIIDLYCKTKTDINLTSYGKTPLLHAIKYSSIEVVDKLLRAGAGVNNITQYSPLSFAVAFGTPQKLKLLIDAGADVDARGLDFYIPLHLTATYGNKEKIKILVRAGADLERRNNWGSTPLIRAAEVGCTETVRLLVELGAHIGAVNDIRRNAYYFAKKNRVTEMITFLRKKINKSPTLFICHQCDHLKDSSIFPAYTPKCCLKSKALCIQCVKNMEKCPFCAACIHCYKKDCTCTEWSDEIDEGTGEITLTESDAELEI